MKKRVLLIATVQSHIGQFHKPLMKMLKENGWEIHVAARNNLAEKDGLELEYPDQVFDVPFQRSPFDKQNIKAFREIKRILSENHYDIIHCNTPVGGIIGRVAGNKYRKRGTRVFYTAHGFHFYKGSPKQNWIMYYPIEKWLSRLTDRLITINEEDYELARRKFHCAVYHIHGVGANSTKFHPISRTEKEIQKKELGLEGRIIVNVGELLPNKNQKTAIRAMEKVAKQMPDAKLLIAGNGPEKEMLEALIREKGLEHHVKLIGYTTKLEKYLQVCGLVVACSKREGLGLNLIEAMLCGKSVVASDNRGHRELVKDKWNGRLVKVEEADDYASAIIEALSNDELRKTMECRCREIAECYTDLQVKKELGLIYGNAPLSR